MTEKRIPTYDLDAFKRVCRTTSTLAATGVAYEKVFEIGFGPAEMVNTIQSIKRGHFNKSMTSYFDLNEWQDVYHVPSSVGLLYVKFRSDTVTEFLLLSFKEKEP